MSYLHIDAEPEDPRPKLRHALLVACGRADVAHAEASLRYAHRGIRCGAKREEVTREWLDVLGDGIREATRRGSPVHRLDPARITRARALCASAGAQADEALRRAWRASEEALKAGRGREGRERDPLVI